MGSIIEFPGEKRIPRNLPDGQAEDTVRPLLVADEARINRYLDRANAQTAPPVEQVLALPKPDAKAVSSERLAIANLQYQNFELEKAIAMLTRESDGGSKTIPALRKIQRSIESSLALLS